MSTAHDEIDQIHETEKAAKKRIDDAQIKARKIHEKADEEAKKIVEVAEKEANETATKKLSEIQSKKVEIESQVFKETDKEIKKIQADAQKKRGDAYQAVIKIILGEV
jgi:vacuolar-type H+-ATPase subunit H